MQLNSTGRQQIDSDHFTLDIDSDDRGYAIVTLQISRLDDLKLPENASVLCEVYRRNTAVRLSCGTVAHLTPPDHVVAYPMLFSESPQVRVRVVSADAEHPGLLLAEGRPRTSGEEPAAKRGLLNMRQADIGQKVWKLITDEVDGPVLVLSRDLPDVDRVIHTVWFRSLVLPQVMREIALWLTMVPIEDLQDEDTPASSWMRYLSDRDEDLEQGYMELRENLDGGEPDGVWQQMTDLADKAAAIVADEQQSLSALTAADEAEEDW
jgi:hypothetical protein